MLIYHLNGNRRDHRCFRALWLCILLFVGSWPTVAQEQTQRIHVMSFNIRYGTANDGINRWDLRKEFLAETIRNFDPDLLGTQETLASQRDFIAETFPNFGVVAAGRDDGKEAGEMAALFYRKDRFEPLEQGHFWLSQTPDIVGSKGWDAALPRIATWVKLKDLQSTDSRPILFVNAHLDHKGSTARLESCRLIRSRLDAIGKDARWIVTGDFNADPKDDPYRALFDLSGVRKLADTFRVIHPNAGPNEGTFSAFDATKTSGPRIDWIACSEEFQVRLARIDRTSRDGRTPSDHFPVTAVLSTAAKSPSLRVLSYNIHHGQGVDDVLSLRRIAQVIRGSDADIVALQEVDQGCGRSVGQLQASELEKLTGYYAVFGKAIDFDGGEYGQAILSRWPIATSLVHRLPNEASREQRIVLEAMVPSELGLIRVLGTHLDHSKQDLRQLQSIAVDALLDKLVASDLKPIATVLAGDLNDTPKSRTLESFQQRWQMDPRVPSQASATYPSGSPKSRIDYVMVERSGRLELEKLEVLQEPAGSDHLPVLATLLVKP